MNKKILICIRVGVGILMLLGLVFFLKSRFSEKIINPSGQKDSLTAQEESFDISWVEWQDPAGFAFRYPNGVVFNNHPEDELNYANLELSLDDKEGKITIIVNDSDYSDLDEWLEKDEIVSKGNSLDTQIASASAKKVALGSGKEMAAMIDPDMVLYLIGVESNGDRYWQKVYNEILDSFRLIPLEGESEESFYNWMEGFDTTGADIVEPVEIIE